MSENQCYEFVALERPLKVKQMKELRAISTRAEISPTRFLERVPVGRPQSRPGHRELSVKEAKRLIDKARGANSLRGVSQDDLLAPYRKHAKGNHAKLCRVLAKDYEIALSLKDFVLDEGDEKATAGYFINPLQFARIERATRLLVINCHYVLAKRPRKARLEFDVAADSVTFHLFESVGSTAPARRRRGTP